ncbi:helix-turn-helix domain-containing protein [Desertihabitans brevis]|nr:AraC family transcriptional regulator [Desertihabitans brevis]
MVDEVLMSLDAPPEVVTANRAVHGVHQQVDRYRLPDLWQLHLYDYSAELAVDGVDLEVSPGTLTVIPPGAQSVMRYRGPSRHLYVHFRTPAGGPGTRLPLRTSAGTALPELTGLLTSAVRHATVRPERTRADVWMVLLRMSEAPAPGGPRAPDHVAAAMSWIESRLSEPVTVPEVAAAVGVSHSQLTRLFRQRAGTTVVGYLRRRRAEVARHLLERSTISIGAVASSVGVPDLQTLNKLCRSVLGASPRQIRAAAQDGAARSHPGSPARPI